MAHKPHNFHLITAWDWQREAVLHAAKETGTPEGQRALVEANRYALFGEVMTYVRDLENELTAARAKVHLLSSPTKGSVV